MLYNLYIILNSVNIMWVSVFKDNEIQELDKQCFGVLPIMAELNLARNQIQAVGDSAFLGLRQLLSLDLSMNNITSINNTAFKGGRHNIVS